MMSIISYCYYLQAALILQVLTIIKKLGDGCKNGALIFAEGHVSICTEQRNLATIWND